MRSRISIFILVFGCSLHLSSQLDSLSDEFNRTCSFYDWQEVNTIEQWNATHLEVKDVNVSNEGQLTLIPWSTAWFQNYRSNLLFKEVEDDFVLTTHVTATNRNGNGVPNSTFSLGGLMVRIPTGITPATWTTGLEDYIFLSIGRAGGNAFQFERKSTTNSNSQLHFENINVSQAELRMVKMDNVVIVMIRPQGQVDFEVLHRYNRPDMVDTTLQVGFVAYTDYNKVRTYAHDTSFYNSHTINGNLNPDPGIPARTPSPDLLTRFDYARFDGVIIPGPYQGLNFLDPAAVSDADIISIFGYDSEADEGEGWKIWKGVDSNWDNPLNWSGNTLPTAQDSILIPNCGCSEVTYPSVSNNTLSYASLVLEHGSQLDVTATGGLNILLSDSMSRVINYGIINVEGTFNVLNSGGGVQENYGQVNCEGNATCTFEE